jgi:protein involved in polysaccharide export with SLBB domain
MLSLGRLRPNRVLVALAIALVSATGPASALAQQGAPVGAAQDGATSSLRPGDVLRLRVWREPDLSGEFQVDENGFVNLPKLGPTQAVGEPIDRLKARIVSAYEAYLKQPSIEVTPLRRIRVAGSVRNPGLYTVDPTMTVADAIALAGGAGPRGKTDQVRLMRNGKTVEAALTQDTQLAQSPLRSGDQLYVPERRWIGQNPGIVLGAVSAAASLIWALRRR